MKKIKKVVCIFMAIVLLLSGCVKSQKAVVGEWYGENEISLIVSDDGTWKIQGSYGSGTWELCENDVFKFIDYLGNEMEVTLENDENGDYINLSYYGIFYDKKITSVEKDNDVDSSEEYNEENNNSNYNVTYTYQTYNGKGLIQYTKNDSEEKYYAMTDLQGNICYFPHEPLDKYEFKFGSDIVYYSYYTNNDEKNICQEITNYNAESLINNENGEFDEILAIGNSMVLLYRYRSTIDSIEHQYAIMDSTGKFVFPWTPLEIYKEPTSIYFPIAKYIGENIFSICIRTSFNAEYMLINAMSGKVMYLYNAINNHNFQFSKGKAYITGNRLSAKPNVSFSPLDYSIEHEGIGESIYLNTDGTSQAVSDFDDYSNGFVINYEKDATYIYDTVNDKRFKFTEYADLSKSISMADDFGLVTITSKDKQSKFFTTIDCNGKILFEPIEYEEISCSDKKIIYKANDIYNIVDIHGNLLAKDVKISKAKNFDNGVIPTGSYGGYLNADGSEVDITFKF